MRALFAVAVALAALLPGVARASDYLYTFTGTVSDAYGDSGNYPNAGDPFDFSLRVRDSFHHVSYVYLPTGSSAIGGPDYAAGTIFPVDLKVAVDPNPGHNIDFAPLEDGYRTDENYSASVLKDSATKNLALSFRFQRYIPPASSCMDYCGITTIYHYADVQVYSDAFTSPDFREVGSFDLILGSEAILGDGIGAYISASDTFDIALSHLTVERLPAAVPEPNAWIMLIGGLGITGAAIRRRRNVRASVASEAAGHGALTDR